MSNLKLMPSEVSTSILVPFYDLLALLMDDLPIYLCCRRAVMMTMTMNRMMTKKMRNERKASMAVSSGIHKFSNPFEFLRGKEQSQEYY